MSEVRLRQSGSGPVLENETLRLTVDMEAGAFAVGRIESDGPLVSGAWTGVALADGAPITSRGAGFDLAGEEQDSDVHGQGRALVLRRRAAAAEPELYLRLTLYEDQPFAIAQSRLHNTSGRALRVQAFHVFHARLSRAPGSEARFYKQGWQSWSPTLALPLGERDLRPFAPVIDPATRPEREGRLVSEMIAVLRDPASPEAILAGFVSTADQFSQVWLDTESSTLTAASYADGIEIAPGAELQSERAVIDITTKPLFALERYGDTLAREMGAVTWPHIPTGWCSWYQYFGEVREEDILANLERLAELRDEAPLGYVQVDDGYQAEIGDWLTANEKFPHGMARLAERIHERGFKAGLWLAPFLVGERSRLFEEHADWLVRNEAGESAVANQNWDQLCYALDCTHPEALDWLDSVFRTAAENWGYDYVKIDFIYAAAIEGRRRDPGVTRAQAYRRGLEAIRSAVGERFILGCGAPIGPSVGLVNGMRISPDVAPYWYPRIGQQADRHRNRYSFPAAVNVLRNTVTRYWMHNRLWLNDPDCVLLRQSQTSLTADEIQTLANVIGVSGGMVLDSDDLALLGTEQIGTLAKLLPLRGDAALPLDLFEHDLPGTLWRPGDGLLAVVNWDDEAAVVTVDLPSPAGRLTDYWSGEACEVHEGKATFHLPAHGSRLLRLTPARG